MPSEEKENVPSEEILLLLREKWEESSYGSKKKGIPDVLVAIYQYFQYLVVDDSKTIVTMVGNKNNMLATYRAVKRKCIETTTKKGGLVYTIKEKDALQIVCKDGLNDKAKFVLDEIGPIYWNAGKGITPRSIKTTPKKKVQKNEDSEESEVEEEKIVKPAVTPKRGRGRPRKVVEQVEPATPVKRGRGRPRKVVKPASSDTEKEVITPVKRGRGRPRKIVKEESPASSSEEEESSTNLKFTFTPTRPQEESEDEIVIISPTKISTQQNKPKTSLAISNTKVTTQETKSKTSIAASNAKTTVQENKPTIKQPSSTIIKPVKKTQPEQEESSEDVVPLRKPIKPLSKPKKIVVNE